MSGLIAKFSSRRFSRAFCASSILVLLSVTPILGQEGLSTLRGTITDKSGAVVAGVSISAREVSTNIVARSVTTNADGSYEMPGLKTGTYQVTATLAGFKKSVTDDVMLQSNQVRRVDITLEVGDVASEVTVSAAAAAIQTEQGKIGADFNAAKRYWDLPIPGNAFSGTYAVLAILPEVQREPGDWGAPRFAGQGGAQVRHGPRRNQRGNLKQPDRQHGVSPGSQGRCRKPNSRVRAGWVLRHDHQERHQRISRRSVVLSSEFGSRSTKFLRGPESQGNLPHH